LEEGLEAGTQREGFVANIKTTPEEMVQARVRKYAKKAKRKQAKSAPKKQSIRAISGGLPSLGKHR
jgi:hypothetical protein